MKAISIRQPWADLIIQGKKTLELRNWTVKYRGILAIHASQALDELACRELGIDPRQVSTGVLIGTVHLEEIIELDEVSLRERKDEHLYSGPYKAPLFGWRLSNPEQLENPVPFTGRMSLFSVPDDLVVVTEPDQVKEPRFAQPQSLDSRQPFELQVNAETGTHPNLASYRLALYQRPPAEAPQQHTFYFYTPNKRQLVCELGGTSIKVVADAILEALRLNGYAATDLGAKRQEPFRLTEESGVRLALIFLAIRPVTKVARIEEISRGIRMMTNEELYYWFSKCTALNGADRAQRALRHLLSEE